MSARVGPPPRDGLVSLAGRAREIGQSRPVAVVTDADTDADVVASQLFRDRYGTLVQMARLLVDDTESAEEVVQEAFVRLYGSWRRLRDPGRAEAYVRSAVRNLARDQLRRRRTVRRYRAATATATGPDAAGGVAGAPPAGPADALIDAERRRQLAFAVDRLPGRQRECVLLRYWADLSEREIAATLGISPGSVKRHVHRAVTRLEAELRDRRSAP
jgi:RNA polymerase sigma-70 factor (sigma-E family)